jgi:hypothetical protein
VTDDVDREGAENRKRVEAEKAARLEAAAVALKKEIERRVGAGEPRMHKRQDAEPFLMGLHLTRQAARKLLEYRDGKDWVLRPDPDDRRTIHVLPPGIVWERPHYSTSTEAAQTAAETDVECGRPHEQAAATSATNASRQKSAHGRSEKMWPHEQHSPAAAEKPADDDVEVI